MLSENTVDEKLIQSIQKLNTDQKEKLLSFIDSISDAFTKSHISLDDVVKQMRSEAAQNNLTEEILSQILSEEN